MASPRCCSRFNSRRLAAIIIYVRRYWASSFAWALPRPLFVCRKFSWALPLSHKPMPPPQFSRRSRFFPSRLRRFDGHLHRTAFVVCEFKSLSYSEKFIACRIVVIGTKGTVKTIVFVFMTDFFRTRAKRVAWTEFDTCSQQSVSVSYRKLLYHTPYRLKNAVSNWRKQFKFVFTCNS